ncbi:hypothetical protein ABZ726_17915 [Streptomyces hundungensis]|uniref:hypothetical protein n=1 Tax=Streptomyces hundungensis TaxID=1077946 RepID=UPI003403B60A
MSEASDIRPVRDSRIVPVMAATRISPIVSLHCEMMGSAESAFPATQAVESYWREFDGLDGEMAIREAARPRVAALLASADQLVAPWTETVRAALRTIMGVLELSDEDSRTHTVVIEAALAVAYELDQCGLNPPVDAATWVAFETACHTDASSRVMSSAAPLSPSDLFDLSLSAGVDGMQYHRALKEWSQENN